MSSSAEHTGFSKVVLARPLIEPHQPDIDRNALNFLGFQHLLQLEKSAGLARVLYQTPEYGLTAFIPFCPTSPYYMVISSHPVGNESPSQTIDEHKDLAKLFEYINYGIEILINASEKEEVEAITVTQHVRYDGKGCGSKSKGFTHTHVHIEAHLDQLGVGFENSPQELADYLVHRELHDPTVVIAKSILAHEFPDFVLNSKSDVFIATLKQGEDFTKVDSNGLSVLVQLSERWKYWFDLIAQCFLDSQGASFSVTQRLEKVNALLRESTVFDDKAKRMLRWMAVHCQNEYALNTFNCTLNGTLTLFIDLKQKKQELRFAPRTYLAPESQIPGLVGLRTLVLKDRQSHPLSGSAQNRRLATYRDLIAKF